MGSLMAGWDKHPWNEEQVLMRSKTSLTKEEIEEYWRKRQLAMEEHLKDAKAQSGGGGGGSQSETRTGTPCIAIPQAIVEELELPPSMSPDWWTRSNWAFLNSPPEKDLMDRHSKYTAQYEVANKATQAT